jgi:sulfofructose kinase
MINIVGVGASLLDIIMVCPNFPKEDTKMRVDKILYQCGGPCSTALVTSSILGSSSAYLGCLTDDNYSTIMYNEFLEYGVQTEYVIFKKSYASAFAVVLVSQENGSRTIIWNKGTLPSPTKDEIPEDIIKNAKVLILDGNHTIAGLHAAEIARKNGVKVLLDAGNMYPDIENFVKVSDLLIISDEFSRKFSRLDNSEDAATNIFNKYNPEILVITKGKEGGILYYGKEIYSYPSFPVKVVDTTGAGDVFHGAYAFGYTLGWSPEKICHFSSAVSALKCTKLGGRTGIPTYNETIDFLINQKDPFFISK